MSGRAVWKYDLSGYDLGQTFELDLPANAVRHFGMQNDKPYVWIEIEVDSKQTRPRRFTIIGTGWEVPTLTPRYVGTIHDGSYVWHLYTEGYPWQ